MSTWGRGLSAPDASAPAGEPVPGKAGFASAAASGSAWTTLQTVANKFVTVFAMLVLARLLTPAEFGLASLASSIGSFAFVLAPFVMGDVLIAQSKRFDELSGSANAIAWVAGFVLCLLLAAAAIPIEHITGKSGLALLVVIAAFRPLFEAALMAPNTRRRIDLAYRRTAFVDGGVILFATILSVVMALLGAGPMALILPPIGTIALRAAFYWRDTRGRISTKVHREFLAPLARQFVVAGFGQYLNNILLILEVLVLGFFASDAEIGLFGLAFQLAMQVNVVIAVQLGNVLQPIFGFIRNDPERQIGGFIRATRLLSSIAVPLSLMQAALAVPMFSLLFEAKWTGSIAVFAVLSVVQAFVVIAAPSIALLKAQGRFRVYFIWQLTQLVTAILAFVFAVNYGSAFALKLASAVGLPVDPNAGKALALSMASALVWAASCPIAVWLGGRPARLTVRRVLLVFFEPWIYTVPVCVGLIFAWLLLRSTISPRLADVGALVLLGPIAVALAIGGSVWMRADTRADFRSVIGRFTRRTKG